MVGHKFKVGDRVRFLHGPLDGEVPQGVYTISRKLPVEGAVCQYRVRHDGDNHERVVREELIAPAS